MDAKKNDPSNSGLNYRELMKRRMSGKMDEGRPGQQNSEEQGYSVVLPPSEILTEKRQNLSMPRTKKENESSLPYLPMEENSELLMDEKKDILQSSLLCVEAVVAAYKRTPSSSTLKSLKDALQHAIETCSKT
jgi:hypothetical protein